MEIKNTKTLNQLIDALCQLRDKIGGEDSDPQAAVRVEDSQPVEMLSVQVTWWLADAKTGELLEYGGPFDSEDKAREDAKNLDKWYEEPVAVRVVLLDSEAV